ncbi:MAG: hypothetical protein HYY06_32070 [Deltaproteobacteria bacterium]|nr:hypothetical protein [Deltaproteobacteria bacterium]
MRLVSILASLILASGLAEAQPAPGLMEPAGASPAAQSPLPPPSAAPAEATQAAQAAGPDFATNKAGSALDIGPFELALQLGGNLSWAEVGEVTFWVPTAEVGAWMGTPIARDSTLAIALGYHFRGSKAPEEIQHRHLATLAIVRPDGAVFVDIGPGFFSGSGGSATSIAFGCTVQAKLFGTGFSLVVPFYVDVVLGAEVPAWLTFGLGIGYTTL